MSVRTLSSRRRPTLSGPHATIYRVLAARAALHRIRAAESFKAMCVSRQELQESTRTVPPSISCSMSAQRRWSGLGEQTPPPTGKFSLPSGITLPGGQTCSGEKICCLAFPVVQLLPTPCGSAMLI